MTLQVRVLLLWFRTIRVSQKYNFLHTLRLDTTHNFLSEHLVQVLRTSRWLP